MNQEETTLFDVTVFQEKLIADTLNEVYDALQERGYDPKNQIVGYLISGDPGYISSHKNAREKMTSIDRTEIVAALLKEYMRNR